MKSYQEFREKLENKNFKSIESAKEFKLQKDVEYITHLIEKYNISEEISNLLINYVKISQ